MPTLSIAKQLAARFYSVYLLESAWAKTVDEENRAWEAYKAKLEKNHVIPTLTGYQYKKQKNDNSTG